MCRALLRPAAWGWSFCWSPERSTSAPDPACVGTHLAWHLLGARSPKHVLGPSVLGLRPHWGFMEPSLHNGLELPLVLLSLTPHFASIRKSHKFFLQNIKNLTLHSHPVPSHLHLPPGLPQLPPRRAPHWHCWHNSPPSTQRPKGSCSSLSLGRSFLYSELSSGFTSHLRVKPRPLQSPIRSRTSSPKHSPLAPRPLTSFPNTPPVGSMAAILASL